jgi:hypothetical protein
MNSAVDVDELEPPFAPVHESAIGPGLPISQVCFDGGFRRDSRLVVLTWSFVEIDPRRTRLLAGNPRPRRSSIWYISGSFWGEQSIF